MDLMPLFIKDQRGIISIFVIIAAIIAVSAGAGYAVKNNLVSIKEGKLVLNQNRNKTEIGTPADSNKSGSSQTSDNTVADTVTYKPDNVNFNEPQFSIIPPAGWEKSNGEGRVKLDFYAPQKDEKRLGKHSVNVTASIQVTVEKTNAKSLEEPFANLKSQAKSVFGLVEISNEKKTALAENEAIYYEMLFSMPNLDYFQLEDYAKQIEGIISPQEIKNLLQQFKGKAAGYMLIKNGYAIGVEGVALASAWDKRGPQIESSMNSFKFLSDPEKTQTATSPTLTSTQPTTIISTGKPIEISDYDTVFGSKEEISWDNPYKLKPPIPFSMKEPLNWHKKVPSYQDNKSYAVEYEGEEESQTGKNGAVLKIKPTISVTMIYNPNTDLEQEIRKLKASITTREEKIIDEKNGTFFGETGYYIENTSVDYKTGVLSKSQSYLFYKNGYVISIGFSTLDSTWDKWYSSMKSVLESFKFL